VSGHEVNAETEHLIQQHQIGYLLQMSRHQSGGTKSPREDRIAFSPQVKQIEHEHDSLN
jgi:hypothetical protein